MRMDDGLALISTPERLKSHHSVICAAITVPTMQCSRRLLAPAGFMKRSLDEFKRLSALGV
jgi:hypothetical protein